MLFLLVGINLVTSVAIFALPSENTKLPRSLATGAAAISLAISIVIFATYDQDVGGYQFQQLLDWLPAMGISLHFGVDGISSPMVLLTGVVSLTAILVSRTIDTRPREYFGLMLLLIAGTFGVFVALDLFFLFFVIGTYFYTHYD